MHVKKIKLERFSFLDEAMLYCVYKQKNENEDQVI